MPDRKAAWEVFQTSNNPLRFRGARGGSFASMSAHINTQWRQLSKRLNQGITHRRKWNDTTQAGCDYRAQKAGKGYCQQGNHTAMCKPGWLVDPGEHWKEPTAEDMVE